MVNKLVSRGTSRRSSAPPNHSSTPESIINENLYNCKQFSASYWIYYCSCLQILHKQPCEGTQIGCTAYSFEKNIIIKSEQIWINNQLANRILCIILFYLIQLRDHKDILLITSSHDSNLEVSSPNLFKHSEIHMSLRFLSPAFIWDWMEDNETKNQMWPRFNGHSLAGLICKVDQTYW